MQKYTRDIYEHQISDNEICLHKVIRKQLSKKKN